MGGATAAPSDDDAPTSSRTHPPAGAVEGRVRAAVEAVPDPELPAVTIGMLGMVHDLVVDGGAVTVTLLPTFAGCPATDLIRTDVEQAVAHVDGVTGVRVVFRFDPVWTPARISDQGRRRLADFGIAPPVATPSSTDGRPVMRPDVATLPVVTTAAPESAAPEPADLAAADPADLAGADPTTGRQCPWCGALATERDSAFGPTPCRDLWMCHGCRQPFEGFKSA